MKAIVYHAPGEFAYEDVADPEPQPNEVVIAVKNCGLCRTDMHIHKGHFLSEFPLINGHEFAGEIADVGADVTAFRRGDRVVADNTELCGHCFFCRRDQPLFCDNFISHGCNVAGGFAEYVAVKAEKVFPIQNLSYRQAIMAEPTACAMHGIDVMQIKPGSDVLIFGAGPTGLILAQLTKLNGAARLTVAAPAGQKLDLARKLAADEVVCVDKSDFSKHTQALLAAHPKGFDTVIEATGVSQLLADAVQFTRTGGQLIAYGVYPEGEKASFCPEQIFRRELTIKGSFAQTHCFDRALLYLESGMVKVDEMVTGEYPLSEYGRALEAMDKRQEIKIAIVPGA
ncbi:MAG: alcohol dehydrogenase catalytic domain-containing protein [Nitrospiraceae bacterium]|nr:alcohol dehydrogenase catalytic domain-containing protein [Nitrospiraceae bacterium]